MSIKMSKIYNPVVVLLFSVTNFLFSCNNMAQSRIPAESENTAAEGETGVTEGDKLQANASAGNRNSQYEWPCFHGLDRRNKSAERGLMDAWPEGGPELVWTASGLGQGYASVSVADDLIFTSGAVENKTYVFAYDLNGNLIWQKPNGTSWKVEVSWASGYDGPRSTPTYDNGIVYHLSEAGRLTAYDARTGEEIWARNLMDDFLADMPEYGFTESVLVDGDKLFIRPAGRKGFQVCLDKKTGETMWTNNDIPGLYAYNSPVIHNFGGYRQLIGASSSCYYGIDITTGRLLWKADFENSYEVNCTDAVAMDEYVLMSSGQGGGCTLIRLIASGRTITTERVYLTEIMDNYHGGILIHDGYIYGSGDRNRGWFSLELLTGKQMWKASGSMGSLTYADGMLYLYNENGRMRLVKASPESYEVTGEFEVPGGGKGPYWAHPVVCGGRLYLRHAGHLHAYNISRTE